MDKILAVDPGIAFTGVVAAGIPAGIRLLTKQQIAQQMPILGAILARTKRDSRIPAIKDRVRRINEISSEIIRLRNLLGPAPVLWVVEAFTAQGPRITNASIQTLAVVGACLGLAKAFNDISLSVQASAHKSMMTGYRSATKAQIYAARAADLEKAISTMKGRPVCKSQQEHLADAASLAAYGAWEFSQVAQGFF